MKYRVIETNTEVELSSFDKKQLDKIISWKLDNTDIFKIPGRVAFYSLRNPLKYNGIEFNSIKIKGLGYFNPEHFEGYRGVYNGSFTNTPTLPQTRTYNYSKEVEHFGIDQDLNFCIKFGGAAPIGGITISKAINEYNNSRHLFENGVSTSVGLTVFEYPNLKFNGENLGIVISLLNSSHPYRLDSLLYSNTSKQSEVLFINEVIGNLGFIEPSKENRLMALERIYSSFGKELRAFSEAGLYRHSGGINNLYFDFQHNRVVLTDLDSSLGQNSLNQKQSASEILRDISSVIFKIAYRYLHPKAIRNFPFQEFKKFDQMHAFLVGFFPEVDTNVLKSTSNTFLKYLEKYYMQHSDALDSGLMTLDNWRSITSLNKMATFSIAYALVYSCYLLSNLNEVLSLEADCQIITKKLSDFLKSDYSLISPYL